MIQSLKTRILPLLLLVAWVTAACAPQAGQPAADSTPAAATTDTTAAPEGDAAPTEAATEETTTESATEST